MGIGWNRRKLLPSCSGIYMKMYISGKITGDPDYKAKFSRAHRFLTAQDHVTMNPANMTVGFTHDEYMQVCYAMIDVCTGVYMLLDWTDSEGAREELEYAINSGKKVFYQKDIEDTHE